MNLRARTIRLAHENPVLRRHLLPILKAASDSYPDRLRLLRRVMNQTLKSLGAAGKGFHAVEVYPEGISGEYRHELVQFEYAVPREQEKELKRVTDAMTPIERTFPDLIVPGSLDMMALGGAWISVGFKLKTEMDGVKKASPSTADLQRALESLLDANTEISDTLDMFESHFKTASDDVASLKATVDRAHNSVEKAEQVVKAVASLVALDPANKDHTALQAKAEKALATLTKTYERARKDFHTSITKMLPTELKKVADKVEKELKGKVLDPSVVTRVLDSGRSYDGRNLPRYMVAVVIKATRDTTDWKDNRVTRPWWVGVRLTEVVGTPGVTAAVDIEGSTVGSSSMKVEDAVKAVLNELRAWPGLKGGAELAQTRKTVAYPIKATLDSVCHRLGYSTREAAIENGYIHAGYRSDLPKEGESAVGEYRYEEMVNKELARARKAVDSAMAEFKNAIARVTIHAEEKSWVSIDVELK